MTVSEDEQDLVLPGHIGKVDLPEGSDKDRFESGKKSGHLVAAEKQALAKGIP